MGGQYLVVGLEGGVVVYDWEYNPVFSYPPEHVRAQVSFHLIVPTVGRWYVANRLGTLIELRLERSEAQLGLAYDDECAYVTNSDIHSLACAKDGSWLAIGHLSSAITVLDTSHAQVWRRHSDDGTATNNHLWSVSPHPTEQAFYAASGNAGTNTLALLSVDMNQQHAEVIAHQYLRQPITHLVPLVKPAGVLVGVALNDYQGKLSAYSADLQTRDWDMLFDEPVTALAADPKYPLAAAGIGYKGRVVLIHTEKGQLLHEATPLDSVINAIAILQDRNRLVAGTTNGTLIIFDMKIFGQGML